MADSLRNYHLKILDSSFWCKPFSSWLCTEMDQSIILTSVYFREECTQMQSIVPKEFRKTYDDNIMFLNNRVRLTALDISNEESGAGFSSDTWGILNVLSNNKDDCVVITADKLLMQRIILNDLNVDIYDLREDVLLHHQKDFQQMKMRIQFPPMGEGTEDLIDESNTFIGSVLFDSDGNKVSLAPKESHSGMEAYLYKSTDHPDMIAKVFKGGKLSRIKFDNIRKLEQISRTLDLSWSVFPAMTLYFDQARTQPAGFLERYVDTKINLRDVPLYSGDPYLDPNALKARLSSSIDLCLMVIRQVYFLNQNGFFIPDFNNCNFSLRDAGDSVVQMWDTDSFGYYSFFIDYCSGFMTIGTYDTCKKSDAIDFCTENAFLFVFYILSLGDPPVSEFKKTFKYSNPQYGDFIRKNFFPPNLWSLFEEVFTCCRQPSMEHLLYELVRAENALKNNRSLDHSYEDIINGKAVAEMPKTDVPKMEVLQLTDVIKQVDVVENTDEDDDFFGWFSCNVQPEKPAHNRDVKKKGFFSSFKKK